jgi:hypothetical protein
VPLSARRVDRTVVVPIAPDVMLELFNIGGRSWDGLAHEAERGSRTMRVVIGTLLLSYTSNGHT